MSHSSKAEPVSSEPGDSSQRVVEIIREGQPSLLCARPDTLAELIEYYRGKQGISPDVGPMRVTWTRHGLPAELDDDVALRNLPNDAKVKIAAVDQAPAEEVPQTIMVASGCQCRVIARCEDEDGNSLLEKAKTAFSVSTNQQLFYRDRRIWGLDDLGRNSTLVPWDSSAMLVLAASPRTPAVSDGLLPSGGLPKYKPGVRKPVILIYSDVQRDVSVTLSLPQGETWTALYPKPYVKESSDGQQTVIWKCKVDAVSDGGMLTSHVVSKYSSLTDKLKYSSLFWESQVSSGAVPNSRVNIDLEQSAIGPVPQVVEGLAKALRAMSMTDTAATDFIQYWIPAFTRIEQAGKDVAIQFISQERLNKDVPLVIEPRPEVLTRIFMVFKAVPAVHSGIMPCVTPRFEWGTVSAARQQLWLSQVNVDPLAFDRRKYTVLEWGGAEVE